MTIYNVVLDYRAGSTGRNSYEKNKADDDLIKDLLTNSIVAITQFQAAFANIEQVIPRSGSHSTTDITEPEIKHHF